MNAFKTTTPTGHISWAVINAPDLTGEFSGFEPAELTSIVIDYTTSESTISGPTPTPLTPAGGDLSGTYPNPTVAKINGNAVTAQTLDGATDGYVLTWDNADGYYIARPSTGGGFSAGGDLSGNFITQTVVKINGASVPVSGSLTTGNALKVSGSSSLTYGAINLAGGANHVSGVLPTANQANQTLGGDLSGTTAAATVTKIQGNAVKAETEGATQDGYVLTWINGNSEWEAKPVSAASGSLAGDVTGGLASNVVTKISGSSPIAITPANLQWIIGTSSPILNQADNTTNSATGQALKIQAQNATGTTSIGGILNLTSGTGTSANGVINLQTGGNTRLTAGATGVITIANLSTGVVHSDSSGNLTSSLIINTDVSNSAAIAYSKLALTNSIVNTDINSSAAIAYSKLNLSASIVNADIAIAAAIDVSKLAAGTSAQVLLNNATPTPTWTTLSSDVTISATGVTTVNSISGSSPITITPAILQWVTGTSSPKLNQADNTTNSATGQTLTIQAQNATGTSANGGALTLTSGTGTSTAGNVNIQAGGTTIVSATSSKWITSKGLRKNITTITGTYQVLVTDEVIIVTTLSASFTITMPASPTTGDTYIIKDGTGSAGSKNLTIAGNSNTIDGSSTFILNTSYGAITLIFSGIEWSII